MKRSIKEVHELIKNKRDNAILQLVKQDNDLVKHQIYGSIMAYQDVLCLLEGSHLLEK